jgi:hypothetical protein
MPRHGAGREARNRRAGDRLEVIGSAPDCYQSATNLPGLRLIRDDLRNERRWFPDVAYPALILPDLPCFLPNPGVTRSNRLGGIHPNSLAGRAVGGLARRAGFQLETECPGLVVL